MSTLKDLLEIEDTPVTESEFIEQNHNLFARDSELVHAIDGRNVNLDRTYCGVPVEFLTTSTSLPEVNCRKCYDLVREENLRIIQRGEQLAQKYGHSERHS